MITEKLLKEEKNKKENNNEQKNIDLDDTRKQSDIPIISPRND